jgi:hypothetical protein
MKTRRRQEGAVTRLEVMYTHCIENDYSVDTMTSPRCDPNMLIGESMVSMDRQGVKDCGIRETRIDVQELFEFVQIDKSSALVASCTNGFLNIVSTTVSSKVHQAAGYHGIWRLGVLLQHIENSAQQSN